MKNSLGGLKSGLEIAKNVSEFENKSVEIIWLEKLRKKKEEK